MTQNNHLPPYDLNTQDPGYSNQPEEDDKVLRNATWGAAILAMVAVAFFIFAITTVTFTDWEDYIMVGFPIVMAGLSFTSISIMQRNRRISLGSGMVFILNLILPILMTLFVNETLFPASYYIILSSAVVIWIAMPRRSWRWSITTSIVALAIVVIINLIDSPNRFDNPPGFDTFVAVVVVVLTAAFALIAARQAWLQNNIRARFLTLSLGLTSLAAVVIAGVSVNSLLIAATQAQETSTEVLRNQTQENLVHQTTEATIKNDLIFSKISQDAQIVAQQAAYIFENPEVFNTESLWVAEEHMFFGPEGQYVNGEGDTSTVFVPNTVYVTERINEELELIAFLDPVLVPTLEGDPNTVAIYFISRNDISWLHPNISLGQIVPPDFSAVEDIFYTVGTPENNPDRKVAWTTVYNDPAGQGLLVSAIAPVYANNRFMGVVGIDVSLASLTANIEGEDFGTDGIVYAFLMDQSGKSLALPDRGYRDFLSRERLPGESGSNLASFSKATFSGLFEDILSRNTGFQAVQSGDQELLIAYATMSSTGWHFASVAHAEEVLAPATALRTQLQELTESLVFQRILPIGLVFMAVVVVSALFFTNRLIGPIEKLSEGAAKIGRGEWDTVLPKGELREINELSTTLTDMADEIKEAVTTLEQRVAERTQYLQLAAEVGRTVSQVSDLETMLDRATNQILEQFDLYYVQIYLVDEVRSLLVLESGTGEVGDLLLERNHSLPISAASINGRAVIDKAPVVIPDTDKSTVFRRNPLLPQTRGEMATPLMIGNRVIGVLDMQSSKSDDLTEEVLPAFEALAGQIAVAIRNANLLEEAEQARAEVEEQAQRQVRSAWSQHMDGIHKAEKIGFSFDRNEITPIGEDATPMDEERVIATPITWIGEELGSLVVELDDEETKEETAELVNIVARQVAQQLENLRLLENAERYLNEAQEVSRRQTREGWEEYMRSRSAESIGYIYDSTRVVQHSAEDKTVYGFSVPLKARDEEIGKVAIENISEDDQEARELVNAVTERLSTHIESLRLYEETRSGQVELDKRAQQLSTVAEISTATSTIQDTFEMLATMVRLTQRGFGLYHAHVFAFNKDTEELQITACGFQEGDPNEGTHETGIIHISQELSLVARAARTRQPVIVNDVRNEPGWLPNPLLPETRAELAVPMVVGDELLGVLDVQSERLNAFGQEDANIQLTLASQVAIALQNARSFAQAQRQAEREAMLNTISQKIQSATTVEAVLQIAARELGHALGAPMTVAQLNIKDQKQK